MEMLSDGGSTPPASTKFDLYEHRHAVLLGAGFRPGRKIRRGYTMMV